MNLSFAAGIQSLRESYRVFFTFFRAAADVLFLDVDIAVARHDLIEHVMSTYVKDGLGSRGPDFVFQLNVQDPPPCAKEHTEEKHGQARQPQPTFQHINSGFYFLRVSPTRTPNSVLSV